MKKRIIEEAEKKIRKFQNEIKKYIEIIEREREECGHEIVPSDPKNPDCSSPVCNKCGQKWSWEWYCPNAPDHRCNYDHDGFYDYDCCKYCGQPEERK